MKFCILLLFFISAAAVCTADLFVIYGEASGNAINVISSTGEIKKTFKVNANGIKGIAIHYKRDLIFVVDRRHIVKIHLLDDDGNPKISGTGELFVDPKASHFESVLIFLSSFGIRPSASLDEATSLMVDTTNNKLYIGGENYVFEMDFDGSNVRKAFMAPKSSQLSTAYINHFSLHKNKFYVGVSNLRNELNGVYQTVVDSSALVNLTNASLVLGERKIYAIAGENSSDNLFYVAGVTQINLMRPVQKSKVVDVSPLQKPRVVLSNFGVTNAPRALTLIGGNMFWSSYRDNKLYHGKLNGNMNFLPLRKIFVIKEGVRVLQMAAFETSTGAVINVSCWFVFVMVFSNLAFALV